MTAKRILLITLGVALAGAGAALLLKDYVIRKMVRDATRALGGFEVTIDKADIGFLSPTIELTGVRVTNPTNYPVREAFEINRIFIRYDRRFLAGGTRHVPELDLDLARIVFVQLPDGRANLEELTRLQEQKIVPVVPEPRTPAPPPPPASAGLPAPDEPPAPVVHAPAPRKQKSVLTEDLTVGRLRIKIDKVDFLQYASAGEEPVRLPAEVNLDRTFEDVVDMDDVMTQLQDQLMVGSLMKGLGLEPPRMEGGPRDDQREHTDRAIDRQIEETIRSLK